MKLQCTLSYLSAFKIKILKDNKDEKFQKPEKCTLEHQKFLRIKLLSRKSTSLLRSFFEEVKRSCIIENKSIWSSTTTARTKRSAFSDDILCLVFLPEKKNLNRDEGSFQRQTEKNVEHTLVYKVVHSTCLE